MDIFIVMLIIFYVVIFFVAVFIDLSIVDSVSFIDAFFSSITVILATFSIILKI